MGLSLSDLANRQLTYLTAADAGATRGDLPAGFRHFERWTTLGKGDDLFTAAVAVLCQWQMHKAVGLRVAVSGELVAGTDVLMTLGVGPIGLVAPCRVVYVVDEPDEFGFAYGTLTGHPESGEESFRIQRQTDDSINFVIRGFSRPANLLARMSGEIGYAAQDSMTNQYLLAMQRLTRHA